LARVRLARSAWRDLKLIRHSIAADSPKRAAAMIGRILDRCVLLGATPAHGRIREDLDVSFESIGPRSPVCRFLSHRRR
jgi:plasmid stabilization system protein ParE